MKKKFLREYFCALCRSPRKLTAQRHLTVFNYGQIVFLSFLLSAGTFKWIGFKGIAFLPIVWALFELLHKNLYRKDLKCPYCGFDPTWYKKDVRLARKKVEEFLENNPNSPILKRRFREENNQTVH